MRVIQIVPELPPLINGVGDYALTLAQNLAVDHGIETAFVVCNPAYEGDSAGQLPGFETVVLPRRNRDALVDAVCAFGAQPPLLLHYVQYGYARRGCPLWLAGGLRTLCKDDRWRLVTMFHELYAPGHFPDSAFWLKSVQRHIARSIARLSRTCATSRRVYAEELGSWRTDTGTEVRNLPIPSGIGEGPAEEPLRARRRQMVVFGLSGTRARAYREFGPELESACRQLEIGRIIDVGPAIPNLPTAIGRVPVVASGPLPPAEASRVLADSVAGFLTYDLAYLGRSSVFAAYCAHGLTPVCVHFDKKAHAAGGVVLQDSLQSSVHFWEPDSTVEPLDPEAAETVAKNAGTWYRMHDQATHAAHFARLLQ